MNEENFVRRSRSYITYIFNSMQNQKGLTNDLAKGLGCFDLETLLVRPIAQDQNCHSQLFTSFRLRNFFTEDQETVCSKKNLSFLDDLRRNYPDLVQPTLFVPYTISFLVDLPSLHSRPLLHKFFRLACLCLDEPFQNLPAVTFDSVNVDDPTSSLVDVLVPAVLLP